MKNKLHNQDSIKKRYFFSLAINILLCVPRFLNASLIPRALGPASFGDYQFLINNFTSIRNFLDMGTATAFFTYSAKNDISNRFNSQYLAWFFIQLILIVSIVAISAISGTYGHIWPGQHIENIILAAVCVWTFLFAQQIVQFGDSKGLTVEFQKMNLFSNYIAATILTGLFFWGTITIRSALLIYVAAPLSIIFISIYRYYLRFLKFTGRFSDSLAENFAYFRTYCSPLVILMLFTFLADFLDRWMLQKFAGAEAQGFYSLSYNWAAIALLFFNPVLNIFWREVSMLIRDNKKNEAGALFDKFVRFLFVITAFISVFLAFNARDIILLIAGKSFEPARFSFMTMMFFPLVQVYGQLAGCLFYAAENTKAFRNIGIAQSVIFTAATYIVMAPKNLLIPGFELGATAFTVKVFLAQLIGTDILVYYICQKNHVAYNRLINHRFFTIVTLVTIYMIQLFFLSETCNSDNLIASLFLKFTFYLLPTSLIFLFFSKYFIGIEIEEIKKSLKYFRQTTIL